MVSLVGLVRHNIADIMKSEKGICDSTLINATDYCISDQYVISITDHNQHV